MEICENYNKEGTPVFMAGIFSTYDGNGEMKDSIVSFTQEHVTQSKIIIVIDIFSLGCHNLCQKWKLLVEIN